MLQDEELDVSPGNSGTEHENLSIVDIQRLIKQEKCEAEELPSDDDLHKITEEQLAKKSVVSSSKSKKSINVKRARLQKPSKVVKKKIMPPATQYERMSNRELLAEMIKSEIMESEVRPVHTCKFCHRNFSSAFILCLHIQIHEKVNRVSKMFEQNKSAAADSVATVSQTENVAAKDVKKSPIVSKSARTVEIKPANPLPKVNKVEMKKKADSLSSVIQLKKSNPSLTVSKIAKVESQITKSVGCSSSSTSNSRIKIKTESIDNCDNLSIKTEKTEPVSFVRNNFVENLKKNLSLAMNRKL